LRSTLFFDYEIAGSITQGALFAGYFLPEPHQLQRKVAIVSFPLTPCMGREKYWNAEEDMFLARSFVHDVSHDAKTGSDQKGKVFWDRLQVQFRTFVKKSTRTMVALTGRWKRMQSSVAKFSLPNPFFR
jgi:hypothetical protein